MAIREIYSYTAPDLSLSDQQSIQRGIQSEHRVLNWLQEQHTFPWITNAYLMPKCNPYFDITAELDTYHPITTILDSEGLLRVEVKSSQHGTSNYLTRRRKYFSGEDWVNNSWIVLNAGPQVSQEQLQAQLVFHLLLTSRRLADQKRWHRIFQHLPEEFVRAFQKEIPSMKYFALPLINFVSEVQIN